MRLYKYRAILRDDETAILRLGRIINRGQVWCARPDTLNDPNEFAWTCDYAASDATVDLVAHLLQERKGRPPALARELALAVVQGEGLERIGKPIIEAMIQSTRDEVGVACFSTSPDSEILWERYGGGGAGVCVELEVPDALLGGQLNRVIYDDQRILHIDDFLRASHSTHYAAAAYATLLTKSMFWQSEAEVRFLSTQQCVEVVLDGSKISRVILGRKLDAGAEERVRTLACMAGVEVQRTA